MNAVALIGTLLIVGIAVLGTARGFGLIYCHGPRTIYGLLREKIKETWPDARVA